MLWAATIHAQGRFAEATAADPLQDTDPVGRGVLPEVLGHDHRLAIDPAAFVGAEGMNVNIRGLSAESTVGASTSA